MITVLYGQAALADYVKVEENLANPRYPTHLAVINPEELGSDASSLHVRCENNRTEVFVLTSGVFGHQGTVRIRWHGMDAAQHVAADESTTGTSAFLSQPIDFIVRLVEEGSVIIEVEGYNVRGASRYNLNDEVRVGLYRLAETCEWGDQLPELVPTLAMAPIDVRNAAPSIPMSEITARSRLRGLLPAVEEFGRDAVIRMLDEEIAEAQD
jgi:hypothetical protein